MVVLGIETSCDETAAAIVENGDRILSNVVSSQIAIHRPYGGVVPELASRHHVRNIVPVVDAALCDAACQYGSLDGIAVTRGPGLIGSLLVGLQFAKAIAYVHRVPYVGVNHLEGHLYACRLLGNQDPPDRHVALLVSGGHTMTLLVEGLGNYRVLGSTRDDAAGEAFDKVARLLNLGYPGGPVIEKLASKGDSTAIHFPRALARRDEDDFSFSGLKTAVATYVKREGVPVEQHLCDLCASFQQAVIDVLVRKAVQSATANRVTAVVATGGVMANQAIRRALDLALTARGIGLFVPPPSLCTDNGAMIAAAGTRRLEAGERADMRLNATARLPLA